MLIVPLLIAALTLPPVQEQSTPAPAAPPASAPAAPLVTGTLLVLNKTDDTLWLVDPASGARRAELPTGHGPHEVAVSPDGGAAVVADYGDQTPGHTLTVVDLSAGAVTRTLDLAPHQRPHGLAFLPDGALLAVTSETSGALLLVNLAEGKVVEELSTEQPLSHMVALLPDGSRAFTANLAAGSITAFDLVERKRLAVVPTGDGAEGIDVTPDGKWVLVANRAADTLSFVDAGSLEEVAELPCGSFPIRVKVTPDGRHALVSCATSGDVAVFDVAERKELARIAMALPPADGSPRPGAEGAEGADGADGGAGGAGDPEEGPVPIGILIEPGGRRAYIANTNANLVTVLDLAEHRVVARIVTGRQPDGLGWTPLVAPKR
jgi:YVTN family beta-propeller protein